MWLEFRVKASAVLINLGLTSMEVIIKAMDKFARSEKRKGRQSRFENLQYS